MDSYGSILLSLCNICFVPLIMKVDTLGILLYAWHDFCVPKEISWRAKM